MDQTLETSRLIIQPASIRELKGIVESLDEPEIRTAFNEMLSGCIKSPESVAFYAPWKITVKNDGTHVGDFCFKGKPSGGAVEIGYGTIKKYEGNGYMTEAVGAAVKWAFSHDAVDCVYAETDIGNAASQRVLEKNNFRYCGKGTEGLRFRILRNETEK